MSDTLTPQGYIPRVVDAQIERYLGIFGAVEIAGTKWCGKTWSGLHHAKSVSYIDESEDVARADPSLMTLGEKPHLIDEWQLVPGIWDAVRRQVDKSGGARGSWILTGSSTPFGPRVSDTDSKERPHHSGAGRIGRIRMRPMTLAESGESASCVSLAGLFRGEFEPCIAPEGTISLIEAACRGGWPGAQGMDISSAQTLAREYLRLFYTESAPNLGKDGDVTARLVGSLARNLGQSATHKTLIADMYGPQAKPNQIISEQTIAEYLALLKRSYLVEEVPGWVPQSRDRKRLSVKPKRYLADPSLAIAQLGMGVQSLLQDWQTFGLVFEAMCMRDLAVYAEALPDIGFEPLRYYRDDSGLEADAIIELADGRWAAFEIKVSEDKVEPGLDSLRRLREKLCRKDSPARVREPEFMAVITGVSTYAREVEDNLYVIPIRCLGA